MAGASRGLSVLAKSCAHSRPLAQAARTSLCIHQRCPRSFTTTQQRPADDAEGSKRSTPQTLEEAVESAIRDEETRSITLAAERANPRLAVQDLRDDLSGVELDNYDYFKFQERPMPREQKETAGFFAAGEGPENSAGDGDFEPNDITSAAHAELEQMREMREFSKIISWDMPLLWQQRKAFEPPTDATPLRFRYTSYMGETHPGARRVVMDFHVPSIPDLTEPQRNKFIKLLAARYNPETQRAKMSSDRYPTAAQNKRALGDLLAKVLKECREGKDLFEDVPFDFRHHKQKKKTMRFPDEWKMTDARRKELAEVRKQQTLLLEQRQQASQLYVDGLQVIADYTASGMQAAKEAVPVPAAKGTPASKNRRATTLR